MSQGRTRISAHQLLERDGNLVHYRIGRWPGKSEYQLPVSTLSPGCEHLSTCTSVEPYHAEIAVHTPSNSYTDDCVGPHNNTKHSEVSYVRVVVRDQ